MSTQVVEQLQEALAPAKSSGTETARKGAPMKLKDRNDNKLMVNNLLQEQQVAEEGLKVSGGWYVVEKRGRRKTNLNPPSSYDCSNAPPAVTPVRWVPGGKGLLPTPPALAPDFYTRRNHNY